MNLLNPGFLFALAAAAVPLLIHLLSRRRARELPFGSLRFLRRSDRRSMRRVSLRRLLLLAMRTVAVALIVLAFARPVVEGRLAAVIPAGSPRTVVILLDASYSMGALESGGGAAFDRARAAALDVIGGLGSDHEAIVVLFDEEARTVYAAERGGRGTAERALADAAPGWKGTDLRAALAHARVIARERGRGAVEIFIVSDFQRSGIRAGSAVRDQERPSEPGRERVFLVPVDPDIAGNVAVERVVAPLATVHRGEQIVIRAVLSTGPGAAGSVPVRVEFDGRRIIERETEIGAGAPTGLEFRVEADRPGWIRGLVECRADRLRADDVRRFTVRVRERTRVLLAGGAREGFYLAQALEPDGSRGDIELRAVDWDALQSADLSSADVVFAAPGSADALRAAPLLRRFAEEGKRVVVTVAPGLEGLASALSARSLRIVMRPGGEGFARLEIPDRAEGLLAPFGREDLEGLANLRLRGAAEVRGVPAGEMLLRFSDGTPFVWREEAGDGEVVFLAAAPVPAGGDFVLSPWFLPMVQQLALARLGPAPGSEGALVGGSALLPAGLPPGCEASMPDGSRYLIDPGAAGRPAIPAGDRPGFISVACGDRWEIAVNPDCRRESDLSQMTPGEAADSLGVREFASAPAGTQTARAVAEAREGKEIAGALAAAALLLLAAELVVAQGGKPASEEGS